ncbi:MAG: MauE/DoxX family redox-associated membrane protein [bacterium]
MSESTNKVVVLFEKYLFAFFKHRHTITVLQLMIGGLFVLSGTLKLTENKAALYEVVYQFKLVPEPLIMPFITILPFFELFGGVLTVLNVKPSIGLTVLLGLLVMFMGAITIDLFRGIDLLECGCFGSLRIFGESSREVLFRDSILVTVNLWLLYVHGKSEGWLARLPFFRKHRAK